MRNELLQNIKVLNELMWDRSVLVPDIERWLRNFDEHANTDPTERDAEHLHALFLLSHFTYFNAHLMRVLLHALYRDLIQYPIIAALRRRRKNTTSLPELTTGFERRLRQVRFLGMGRPSESGAHLLYYFRQENELPTELFVHPHDLMTTSGSKRKPVRGVRHLVFLDDFCGSGTQAVRYSKLVLQDLRKAAPKWQFSYYPLFATSRGLKRVRERALFREVRAVCELDDSFRCFDPASRYFRGAHPPMDAGFAKAMCRRYGKLLSPDSPLGFGQCQLLLGFAHNVPNNTLPIIWGEGTASRRWDPIFRRHRKVPGWS